MATNHSQPRKPAGRSGGGQWDHGAGAGSATELRSETGEITPAENPSDDREDSAGYRLVSADGADLVVTLYGSRYQLIPVVSRYENNAEVFVGMYTDEGEDFADVSVNVPGTRPSEGCVFTRDIDNGIGRVLVKAGWLEPTGRSVPTGFINVAEVRPAGPLAQAVEAAAKGDSR